MNEKLKFSWGHILAFIAIILMCYFTFTGGAYLGNFVLAGIASGLVLIILVLFFIGPQFLKGTERKFAERIIWERLLLFLAPFVLAAMLLMPQSYYAHFWQVEHQHKEIVQQFDTSIIASKQMFNNYEEYAKSRTERLRSYLEMAVETKDSNNYYADLNFNGNYDEIQIETRIQALRTQLFPSDYDALKKNATEWIDKANRGATVWNVFLVGNVPVIKEAINNWHQLLQGFSSKKFDIEGNVDIFDENRTNIAKAQNGLSELERIYSSKDHFSITSLSIMVTIICYLFLMMPYIIQRRSAQSRVRLFRPKKTHIHKPDPNDDKDHGIIWDSNENANKK